jgi:uncharacterized protein (DUF2062 family)
MHSWLKRITPDRARFEKHGFLRPFRALLRHEGCWGFHRSSVTRAFALGLFIAFIPPIPFLPVHLLICALLGLIFRLNLPVLFAATFISNPFTWLPQIAGSIWVGAKLMGVNLSPLLHELGHRTQWSHLSQLWAPLLLGAFVLGVAFSLMGYLTAQCLWRVRVTYLWQRRRTRILHRRTIG